MENTYSSVSNDVTCDIGIKIPRQIADALDDGKIILSATYGKSGVTTWVQFPGPDSHITYDLDSALDELNNSPSPDQGLTPPSSPETKKYEYKKGKDRTTHFALKQGGQPTSGTVGSKMSYKQAANLVSQAKLDRHRINGVLNFYPADSLAPQDFKRASDDHFLARVTVVAHKIGTATAAQRVLSGEGAQGATDLNEWWDSASARSRALLLTRNKKCDVTKVNVSRLSELANPFGCAELQKEEDEDSADAYTVC